MSFSYSGNPTDSSVDALRFMLSDTDASSPIFTDEELEYMIGLYGDNPLMLEYQVFNQAATLFARSIKRTLGPQSEDPTSRLNFFKNRADQVKAKLIAKGLSVPRYQYPKIFYKGMMDNPPAKSWGNYV